jgi:hypothetical protein
MVGILFKDFNTSVMKNPTTIYRAQMLIGFCNEQYQIFYERLLLFDMFYIGDNATEKL